MAIELLADLEELNAAGVVARNVELKQVHLVKIVADNNYLMDVPADPRALSVMVKHSVEQYSILEPGTLFVPVQMVVEFRVAEKPTKESEIEETSEQEEPQPFISLYIQMVAKYQIPLAPAPKEVEKGLPVFSKLNGPYTCWPYFRNHVNQLTNEMGFPFVLPVLRITTKSSMPDSEEEVTEE